MTSLLIRDCRLVVTMDVDGAERSDVSIAIRDGWFTYIGDRPPQEAYDLEIDGSRFVVIPGLINTHHHLYQTLTRGFPESQGQGLFPWLRMLYPIWANLDEEMIFTSTQAGLAELALSGCTTSADHLYVFPPGSEHFMDAQVEAARGVGLRFHPTRGSMDLSQKDGGLPPDSVVQSADDILKDSERVIDRYHDPAPGAMVRVGLAPCSPFSVSPELMRESAGLARRKHVRLHTHIAETRDEDSYSRERFGVSPIAFLDQLGWMSDDVWLAHCVHVGDADMGVMAAARVGVAHCPTSNMLLGSGMAPVPELIQRGITVGLGVDGSASNDANNLRAEVKQAVLSARVREDASALSVRAALRIATSGGAACLGRSDIGSIEPGKAADLVCFNAEALELAGGQDDLVASIVLGAPRPELVIVNGEEVVRGGQLAGLDADELARRQNAASRHLMAKFREM